MIAVVVPREQHTGRVIQPQVRISARLIAVPITVAVHDDERAVCVDGEPPVRFL